MVAARAALLVVLALTGCQKVAIGAADRSALVAATQVESCPIGVPEARIRAVETPQGVDVHFSAPPERVEELRRRVRGQARANGPDRHRGDGHDGEHRGPRDHGLRLWSIAKVTAQVEDTDTGAKLAITPVDPAELAEVRSRITARVDHLANSECVR